MSRRHRIWHSPIALKLRTLTGAETVEAAVSHVIDAKLKFLRRDSFPVRIEHVASICDIQGNIQYVDMVEDARLVPDNGKYYINVNRNHSYGKQRFSIAHEIAHKIFFAYEQHDQLITCSDIGQMAQPRELEALCDIAAQEILGLGIQPIRTFLENSPYDLGAAQLISQSFEVSFEAACVSMVKASSSPVAYILLTTQDPQEEKRKDQLLLPNFVEDIPPRLGLWIHKVLPSPNYYSYGGYIPLNKSIDKASRLYEVIEHNTPINGTEFFSFNGKSSVELKFEARSQNVYVNGQGTNGIIALFSKP